MRPDARAWFELRTTSAPSLDALDLDALLRAKRRGRHRISVVLPARDEEATVGGLVADLHECWVTGTPLVDELLVVDSDSTDATAAVARGAGALRAGGLLTQFRHDGAGFVPHSTAVAVDERPPMATVPEYRAVREDVVVG